MLRFFLISIILLVSILNLQAQNLSQKEKLYYTCKVWGYVKYYHSEVSNCNVNWDSVLLKYLPIIKSSTTKKDFNNVLDSIVLAAGPMAIAVSPPPSTLPLELRRNIDFNWFNDTTLSKDIRNKLDTIKNNFRPHNICWVDKNDYLGSYTGYLVFPFDTPMLDITTHQSFPKADNRLLLLFKYWNLINYFNPYNYVLDTPWDSTLNNYVIRFDTVSNAKSLYYLIEKLTTELDDVHVEGRTVSYNYQRPTGDLMPPIRLKYIDPNYVVVTSKATNVFPGDILLSVDGITTNILEDSIKQYVSAGNPSVLRRELCEYIISREDFVTEDLVLKDSNGNNKTVTLKCNTYVYNDYQFYRSNFYPVDSLKSISWTVLPCDVGYVNLSNLDANDASSMYDELKSKNAIIFDLRDYPKGNYVNVTSKLFPSSNNYASLIVPDINYPGTFYWQHQNTDKSSDPYQGKVVMLINEHTQSYGEFYTMTLETMPNAITVGSQTAGADGNITYWNLTKDIATGFTSLDVFYGNKDSTQRIGIVPDSFAKPSIAGIRNGKDEVLEAGLLAAGCYLDVDDIKNDGLEISLYPNPATDRLDLRFDNVDSKQASFKLFDVTGKVVYNILEFDVNMGHALVSLPELVSGVYFCTIQVEGKSIIKKIVIQH